jgi:hypothetical protein
VVKIIGLSSTRSQVFAGLVAAAIVAAAVGVAAGVTAGPQSKGYCLYVGVNQSGDSGALAVPHPNSTQSSCNALEEDVQILFANWQTRDESFAISSDRPVALSSGQAAVLKPFAVQPGWLIYSGSI